MEHTRARVFLLLSPQLPSFPFSFVRSPFSSDGRFLQRLLLLLRKRRRRPVETAQRCLIWYEILRTCRTFHINGSKGQLSQRCVNLVPRGKGNCVTRATDSECVFDSTQVEITQEQRKACTRESMCYHSRSHFGTRSREIPQTQVVIVIKRELCLRSGERCRCRSSKINENPPAIAAG